MHTARKGSESQVTCLCDVLIDWKRTGVIYLSLSRTVASPVMTKD